MFRAQDFLDDEQSPAIQGLCQLMTSLEAKHFPKAVESESQGWILTSQCLFAGGQYLFIELFRIPVPAKAAVEIGQVVHFCQRLGMLRTSALSR